jgi:hypothetical protein
MHDCNKFKGKLVDLLFESADGGERSRLLAEVNACKNCNSLYRSMSETLTAFDQVTRIVVPEESYWSGYENRLRARVTEQVRPKKDLFAQLFAKDILARLPISLRVAFACLVVAAGLWLFFDRIERTNPPAPVAIDNADPARDQRAQENNKHQGGARGLEPATAQRQTIAKGARTTFTPVAPNVKHETEPERAQAGVISERRSNLNDYLKMETATHIEKAELLMRSFRNIRLPEGPAAFDVSYEKQFSKQLLANNRRLRRSAENKRVLSIEDLLTGIEPLLLDIANLPDNPAEDDVRSIKELIQKQEVVAALQFYSAKASSRNY